MESIRNLNQLLDLLRHKYNNGKNSGTKKVASRVLRKPVKDEQHFCVSLAGHTIAVDSLYSDVYKLCKEYESDLPPEIRIAITENDIITEAGNLYNEKPYCNEGHLETLALLRSISEELLSFDTFLMHGAVVAVQNSAIMFTAESGTGKTTHIQKWLENIDGAYVVNGDKPFIRITDDGVAACGSPWCGKENMGTNSIVPLQAIVFMERNEENSIDEISFNQAFIPLMKQVYKPKDAEKMKKTLDLLQQLNKRVRFYHYRCNNFKSDAFDVTYQRLVNIV